MSVVEELKKVWIILSQTKNIPVLLLAASISTVGTGFLSPVLSLFFREKGISFVELGFIFAVGSAASLALRPFIGYLSDRYGRRLIIVGSYLLVSVLTPLYLLVEKVAALATVHASRSVVAESSQPALNAMIGDIAPKEGRATLFGFYSSITSLIYSAALFGGGALLAWGINLRGLFYITAGCLFVSTVVLALFLKETIEVRKEPELPSADRIIESRLKRFGSSVVAMATERSTLGLLLYSFFFRAALGVYMVYIPLFAIEVFGARKELLGPIIAVSWITFAVIQPFGGWLSDRLGKRKILIGIGLILIIIFNTFMAVSSTLFWMVLFWALIGIGDGMFRPVMSALTVDIVPAQNRGTFFGTLGSMGGVAAIVTPLIYGYIADAYSLRWTFLLTSVYYALALLAVILLIREGKVIGEKDDL